MVSHNHPLLMLAELWTRPASDCWHTLTKPLGPPHTSEHCTAAISVSKGEIMKKRWRRLWLGLPALLLIACTASLAVPLRPQQTSMWCWAASGQMAMEFINSARAPAQCVQANNRFGLS